MTVIEAKYIAQQFAFEIGEALTGFKLGVENGEEFTNKYYFDFIWLTLDDKRPKEPPVAGGTRGLTVNKHDGHVKTTTFGDYSALKREERRLVETYQLLLDFKKGKKCLGEIKTKFALSSKQLLKFYQAIKRTELNKENTYEIINLLLGKSKNTTKM